MADPVAPALDAVGHLVTLVQRLEIRFEKNKRNSKKLKAISGLIKGNADFIVTCNDHMKDNPLTSRSKKDLRSVFVDRIKNQAEETTSALQALEEKYYPSPETSTSHRNPSREGVPSVPDRQRGKSTGCVRMSRRLRRWSRANTIFAELVEVETSAEKVQKDLDKLRDELMNDSGVEQNDDQTKGHAEVLESHFFDPSNFLEKIVLDFASTSTIEGKLKSALLYTVAYGLFGYGSSCSASAVQEEFDPSDLVSTYDGGVHFMSFGTEITQDNVIAAIKDIISAHNRDSQSLFNSVKEAAEMAETVLPQKPCLFFCDDLWSHANGAKYFDDLKILVRRHPHSRIVITTRNCDVAEQAGCTISREASDLRAKLISSRESNADIKTCAILGEGGIGKTVSMMGIANQSDIRGKFKGGIYFMSFGQEATTDDVIAELEKILIDSNGVQHAQKLDAYKSAVENATTAAKWFRERPCLFLCDDLWGTDSDAGFFPDLRILTNGHPDSRMVVTTRDSSIAYQAGHIISASSLPPISPASQAILFKHAAMDGTCKDVHFQRRVDELLDLCGGLPLFLAVVGRRLAAEGARDGNQTERITSQIETIRDQKLDICQQKLPDDYNFSLHKAVMSSVEFLDRKQCEGADNVAQTDGNAEEAKSAEGYSVPDMFRSFSVLSKQGWIPVSVLEKLWKTNATKYIERFSRLRLVSQERRKWRVHRGTKSSKEKEENGVILHDLTLDICRLEAIEKEEQKRWHESLLNIYFAEAEYCYDANLEISRSSGRNTLTYRIISMGIGKGKGKGKDLSVFSVKEKHRPWYSPDVPEDGYIHKNLSRHLVGAGRESELWSLLLNPKWSKLWIDFGTSLPLQRSLNSLDESAKPSRNTERKRLISENDMENIEELKLTYRALQCAWGRIQQNPREYPYQMLGRLHDARASMHVVRFFLEQVEANAERPFLRPQHQCFEDPRNGPEMEIHLEDFCSSVQCLPHCNNIIAAVGFEIHEIDVRDGSVLQRCVGHSRPVQNVAVMSAGSLIASADDVTIRVWDKRSGISSGKVFDCDNSMSSVHGSLVVRDCDSKPQIYATVMQGVKAWDVDSGIGNACELPTGIDFIALSADGPQIICASAECGNLSIRNMDRISENGDSLECPPGCGDISCLAVNADGTSIACGTRNGEVFLWDRNSEEPQCEELSDGSRGDVTLALAMTNDAKLLFSGSESGDVRVWDLGNRERRGTLLGRHASWVTSLAISSDGERLFSGSRDKTIRIWDLTKDIFANDGRQNPQCHTGPVTCISSSPDGRYIISGSEDKTVRVWDAKTGTLIGQPLEGHDTCVTKVAVSRDSDMIYSKSENRVCCWDLKTLERCLFSRFAKSEEASSEDYSISLVQREENIVECLYKTGEDRQYTLAKMPAQKSKLQWHINHGRKAVYVGREAGTVMHLKVES